MSKMIDLTGQKFGRLFVIDRADNSKTGKARWICRCECGGSTIAFGYSLTSGRATSCGCYQKEQIVKFNQANKVTHGACIGSRTRLYGIWSGMKQRCYDMNCHSYSDYGGRGISVCDEWKFDFNNFKAWANTNGYSQELTIDRIGNDGNYEPANCRWATPEEQCNNQRSNKLFAINGEEKTLAQWSKVYRMKYWFVWQRVHRNNMSPIEALTRPSRGGLCG